MTTGSTGTPKSVARKRVTPAHALPAASLVAALGLRPREPVLIMPPLFHGHGFSLAAACLVVGAPIIIGSTASAEKLAREHHVGLIAGVPAQLGGLIGAHLPSVRLIAAGSARLPQALAESLLENFDLVDFFGSTETGTATIAVAADLRAGTVGRPAAGVRVSIVDGAGTVVPRGVEGWVRVSSVLGFAGRSPLLTGDRGSLDAEGRLRLAGRADGVVVSGGENISVGALVAYLKAQPEIADAVVTVVPDARLDRVLAASVVLGALLTEAELCERVRAQLGKSYVPRHLVMRKALAPGAAAN
jgi:fatty-acyl-CoA synthase